MNKRIRKKRLAEFDEAILNGIRLFMSRPRGKEYTEIATGLLGLNIGMALMVRHEIVPGPRRGWSVSPPTDLRVVEEEADRVVIKGTVEYVPPGARPPVSETLFFTARRDASGVWRHVTISA